MEGKKKEGSCCVVASNPNIFPTGFCSRGKSEVKDFLFVCWEAEGRKITYSPSFSFCFYWPD